MVCFGWGLLTPCSEDCGCCVGGVKLALQQPLAIAIRIRPEHQVSTTTKYNKETKTSTSISTLQKKSRANKRHAVAAASLCSSETLQTWTKTLSKVHAYIVAASDPSDGDLPSSASTIGIPSTARDKSLRKINTALLPQSQWHSNATIQLQKHVPCPTHYPPHTKICTSKS